MDNIDRHQELSAQASHRRAVSYDEFTLNSVDFTDSPKIVTMKSQRQMQPSPVPSQQCRYGHNTVELPVDMSGLDSVSFEQEPGLTSDAFYVPFGDQWLPHEAPDNTTPISQGIFDDDLIRIPSVDENMRWSCHNQKITISSVGRERLAQAVEEGEEQIHSTQLSILEELKKITTEKSRMVKPKNLIAESEITDDDVICERGGKSNRHYGTKKYRGLIEQYKPKYQAMTAKISKTNLSRELIRMIQGRGGRFLKKDEETGDYYVLCPVETTKKVSQALREKKVLKWVRESSV